MAKLSPAQLAAHLRAAGVPEDKLVEMTAIGLAESGGEIRAHNNNPATGDDSRGPLQVNVIGSLWDERSRKYGLRSKDDLFDPATNARVANGILASQGLGAWSVFKNGRYKDFLGQAQQGVAGAGAASIAAPAATVGAPSSSGGIDVSKLFGSPTPGSEEAGLNRMAAAGITALAGLPELSEPTRKAADPQFTTQASAALSEQPDPFLRLMGQLLGGGSGETPLTTPAAQPKPVATATAGGGSLGIVDLGKTLQGAGLRVRENPAFGGVGKHSEGSLHYSGKAIDVTDWQDPGEGERSWKPRKAFLGQQIAQILGPNAEVFHPGNDPQGHGSHIHVGLRNGGLSPEQLQQITAARQESLKRYPLRWAG